LKVQPSERSKPRKRGRLPEEKEGLMLSRKRGGRSSITMEKGSGNASPRNAKKEKEKKKKNSTLIMGKGTSQEGKRTKTMETFVGGSLYFNLGKKDIGKKGEVTHSFEGRGKARGWEKKGSGTKKTLPGAEREEGEGKKKSSRTPGGKGGGRQKKRGGGTRKSIWEKLRSEKCKTLAHRRKSAFAL